jgi:hypothetical protein
MIDTSKIKAGDWVQIANGDWFEVVERIDGGCHYDQMTLRVTVSNDYVRWRGTASINALYITAHRKAKPEPETGKREWLDWQDNPSIDELNSELEELGFEVQEVNSRIAEFRSRMEGITPDLLEGGAE